MKPQPWKRIAGALALGIWFGSVSCGEEPPTIRIHDTVEHVREVLGEPDGYIGSGDREMWTYRRGRVEFFKGRVVDVQLVSEEEAAERERLREERRRRLAEQQRLQRQRLQAEGEALKARMLADTNFLNGPASVQVAFWKDFRKRYPDVPADVEYRQALVKRRAEIEEERLQRKIRELEARVASAEEEARLAREQADRAERESRHRTYSCYSWPIVTYPLYPLYPSLPTYPNRPSRPIIRPLPGRSRVDIRFGDASSRINGNIRFQSPYSPWPESGSHRVYHPNSCWVEGSGVNIRW